LTQIKSRFPGGCYIYIKKDAAGEFAIRAIEAIKKE
jgi:hypothetical protein